MKQSTSDRSEAASHFSDFFGHRRRRRQYPLMTFILMSLLGAEIWKMEKAMSKKSPPKGSAKASMTKSDAARIQRATAKNNGGQVSQGSFASRAARAAARSSK